MPAPVLFWRDAYFFSSGFVGSVGLVVSAGLSAGGVVAGGGVVVAGGDAGVLGASSLLSHAVSINAIAAANISVSERVIFVFLSENESFWVICCSKAKRF
jgi:hypothetical protein